MPSLFKVSLPIRISRSTLAALISGCVLSAYISDAVPQACATLQTVDDGNLVQSGSGALNWNWPTTGVFDLDQDSNGRIVGTLGGPNCNPSDYYSSAGVMYGNGTFSLTSTYHGNYLGCAATLNMSGTLNGPGCTVASGSWTNSSSLNGSFSMTHGCYVPMGEQNQVFSGWQQYTNGAGVVFEAASFLVQLSPLTFNWGGRTISETFPQAVNDGCWYPGSTIDPIVSPPTRNVHLDYRANYGDLIGPSVDVINYYRQKGRTPCTITSHQVMVIDCPNPPANPTYATNTIVISIGPLMLSSTRGNGAPATEVFGAPAPSILLPAILLNLIFPPH